jgi:hypothetical protein
VEGCGSNDCGSTGLNVAYVFPLIVDGDGGDDWSRATGTAACEAASPSASSSAVSMGDVRFSVI